MSWLLNVYFLLSKPSTGHHCTTNLQWIYLGNTFVSVGKISTKQTFHYFTYDILHNDKIYFKFFIFTKWFTTQYINTTHTFPTLNCISPTVFVYQSTLVYYSFGDKSIKGLKPHKNFRNNKDTAFTTGQ